MQAPGPWYEPRAQLVNQLRSDVSFVWPGADHLKAAQGLLANREAIHKHEYLRTHRHRLMRARDHVNAHLIEGLRRPRHDYNHEPEGEPGADRPVVPDHLFE